MSLKHISNKTMVLRIVFVVLSLSIIIGLIFSFYLRSLAVDNLANKDARKTSEFVFEVLYSKMEQGWAQEDIASTIKRLKATRPGLDIETFRSQNVENLYGKKANHKFAKEDIQIVSAFKGGDLFTISQDNKVRMLHPIIYKQNCLQCHSNAEVGTVAGVIDISYFIKDIMIPLNEIIIYFLIFLLFFLVVIFVVVYLILNKKLVHPLVGFTKQLQEINQTKDLSKKVYIQSNITEIKTLEESYNTLVDTSNYYFEKMTQQLYRDSLTGLNNFMRLNQDLQKKDINQHSLMLINIDNFKSLNDFYGYEVGNQIILALTTHIQNRIEPTQTFYKLSGSEFAILQNEPFSLDWTISILEGIQQTHFLINDLQLFISTTAGIAQNQTRLFEKATAALNEAKQNNRPLEYYHESILKHQEYQDNSELTVKIMKAIEDHRIINYYQPIFDAHDRTLKKYETLVRLIDENGSVISPYQFLPVAKRSRYYHKITRVVIKQAFEYFKNKKDVTFSVNISFDDITDEGTKDYIKQQLESFPEPERVIFEILESVEITQFDTVTQFLQEIKKLGSKIAIDDFGSGYSNFVYLTEVEADFIKIDASLIKTLPYDENSYIIVESIVNFAKKLKIKTIAEYVADEQIYDLVCELDVDYFQGFYLGKPLPSIE